MKVVVLSVTNLFFVAIIGWQFRALKWDGAEDAGKRYDYLRKMVPILTYVSIGISIYYFAKELLFGLDLPEARPIMMRVFLQLLAVLSLSALIRQEMT